MIFELTERQLCCFELPLCELPIKVKFTLFKWFLLFWKNHSLLIGVISLILGVIFTCLEWFLHFSMIFTLLRVTISLFWHSVSINLLCNQKEKKYLSKVLKRLSSIFVPLFLLQDTAGKFQCRVPFCRTG